MLIQDFTYIVYLFNFFDTILKYINTFIIVFFFF